MEGKMVDQSSPAMIATAERRSFVMKFRKSGWTYEKIALAALRKYGYKALPLGYDSRYAYKDVKRELDKLRDGTSEDTEAVRDIELQRLDALLAGIWAKAARGNVAAIDRALRISERRCKLLGVDAPTELKLGGSIHFNAVDIGGIDPSEDI